MKIIKIFGVLVGVIVLLLVTVLVAVSLVDVDKYRGAILSAVEDATGRTLAIDGELDLAISLTPALIAEGVRFQNASWGSEPDMLRVERIEAEVALLPLLRSTIDIRNFTLIDPIVLLEKNADGTGNWEVSGRAASAPPPGDDAAPRATPKLDVQRIRVERAQFRYLDHAAGSDLQAAIEQLAVAPGTNGNLDLTLRAAFKDVPLQVDGSIGAIATLLDNQPLPIDLRLVSAGVSANLAGRVTQPLSGTGLDLQIAAAINDPAALQRATGADLPDLRPMRLVAHLTDAGNDYRLDELAATAGAYEVRGTAAISVAEAMPSISGELTMDLLDLSSETESEPEPRERLFPATPLPVAALKSVNADLKLTIKMLRTNAAELVDMHAAIALRDGRLRASPVTAGLAGGRLSFDLDLDGSASVPSLKLGLQGKGIRLGDLPATRERLDRAATDIALDLSGRGQSVAEIAGAAAGSLLVQIGEGEIKQTARAKSGLLADLLTSVNPFAADAKPTVIECGVIRLAIDDGIARADRGIGVQTSRVDIIGSGTIDLGSEQLDFGIRPSARSGIGIDAGALASLVRVRGTLAEPKVGADVGNIAATGARVGAAIATGGLSALAEGLLGAGDSQRGQPCAVALGNTGDAETSSEPAPAKTRNPAEQVIKGIRGLFKR